jgi:hypothetical protein
VNTDFRIEVGFFDHHKTSRLIASLGLPAAWALLRLWEFATINKPDGDLSGMAPDEIASACRYDGDPRAFLDALVAAKWLDKSRSHGRNAYAIHAWQEHQPFVVNGPARREAARKAAESRWKRASNNDADRMRGASGPHTDRNAPAFQPSSQPEEKTPLPAATPSRSPDLPPPTRSGGSRNRTGGGMQKLGGAYMEPPGIRPKLSPADEARMERYKTRRKELLQEIRTKQPDLPEAEKLAFVTAQLRIEGITG